MPLESILNKLYQLKQPTLLVELLSLSTKLTILTATFGFAIAAARFRALTLSYSSQSDERG